MTGSTRRPGAQRARLAVLTEPGASRLNAHGLLAARSFVADARSWTISAFNASTVASDSDARASAARSALRA